MKQKVVRMRQIPRPEHPRPDFVRPDWMNLNGEWQFAFDEKDQGLVENWQAPGMALPLSITVPFAHQTPASGLNDQRICSVLWYKRSFHLPENMKGRRVLLRFGAVDYRCQVYVNGTLAGGHEGGYTPFALDVTRFLKDGENEICVRVEDAPDCTQPRGKQYWKEGWMGCWYTPTSGIWQTVYLEAVGDNYLLRAHITPDIDTGHAIFRLTLKQMPAKPLMAEVTVSFQGAEVRRAVVSVTQRTTEFSLSMVEGHLIPGFHFWSPKEPNLYDANIRILDGADELDRVSTYFGMRKIAVKDGRVLLNNQPLYQRLVLDQGYWPDSHLTPPSDDAIRADVEWTKKLGYNGARKHQKLEDPRYYYWADKLGLIVWGEVPSTYEFTDESVNNLSATLAGFIDRDYNHPSIICWVPLNESWGVTRIYKDARMQAAARLLYHEAKALDGTRLVSVNDGWEQLETDIFALHDYADTAEKIERHFRDRDETCRISNDWRMASCEGFTPTGKEAFMVTEYGGIAFEDGDDENTWGYHDKVRGEEAFFARYQAVTDAVRAIDYCQGYCYTQLTDVQQETNGILTPDRKPKVDPERFRALTRDPAGR
jgi:beta-galactosidase/beta-glucuronidase